MRITTTLHLVSILVILLLLGGYIGGAMQGVTIHSPLWHRLSYIFAHTHPLHLLLNGWGICSLLRSLARSLSPLYLLLTAVASGVLSTYIAATELPTVGASGVLYYLLGYDLVLRWAECYFRIDPHKMELYTLYLLATICLPAPLSTVNTWLHVVNFVAGISMAVIWIQRRS